MKTKTGIFAILAAGAGYLAYDQLRRRSSMDLRGKKVLITGGSRGLGLAIAREFGLHGAIVAICARDGDELERALEDLRARGVACHAFVCDITDRHQVLATVADASRSMGGIDVLVNNAGIIRVGPFAEMNIEDFEQAMNVMFWGTLYSTLAVLPDMQERGRGSIVNITSIGGKVSVPHLLPYSCAKFAAVALSEGLRTELAPEGIRVTTIAPGLLRTGSHLHAEFKGKQADEYTWFAGGATTPLVSIDAERAARSILRSTIRGESEKILSVPADIFSRLHGILPELSSELLNIMNRLLPSSSDANAQDIRTGASIEGDLHSRIWKILTQMGRRAAESLNELPAR